MAILDKIYRSKKWSFGKSIRAKHMEGLLRNYHSDGTVGTQVSIFEKSSQMVMLCSLGTENYSQTRTHWLST